MLALDVLPALVADIEATLGVALYPIQFPEVVSMPAARYQLVSEVRLQSQSGDSGLVSRRYQFDIEAATYLAVEALDGLLVGRYKNGRGTYGALVLEGAVIEQPRDDLEPTTGRYRRSRDIRFQYQEE